MKPVNSKRIYFKTDVQTEAGTVATGTVVNHKISIPNKYYDNPLVGMNIWG